MLFWSNPDLYWWIFFFCFFLLGSRQKSFSRKWFFYFILTGLFFGLTLSIKWTGLAILGIFGAILLARIFSQKMAGYLNPIASSSKKIKLKESATGFVLIVLTGFIIYLIPFYIHFKLLPHSGPGDAFMSPIFQQELKNPNSQKKISFGSKFYELNQTMGKANIGLSQTHPYSSRWFQWPFNQKSIFYWNREENGQSYKIFLRGNLFLWLVSLLAALSVLALSFFKKFRSQFSRFLPIFFVLIFSYLANLLPFIFIKRVAFLYHYLPALTYALIILAIWISGLWPKQKIILAAILTLILINFILFLPLSFGWPAA